MLVLNLPFKALMFLTLMRPSLVLFLVLWLKLVKDFLKVRCRLALLPFLISCLIWLDLVASLPLRSEERFSRNAETDIVCRLLFEKKKDNPSTMSSLPRTTRRHLRLSASGSANSSSQGSEVTSMESWRTKRARRSAASRTVRAHVT